MYAIILVCASYIAAQMLSDVGSLQIVQFLGLSVDAGTFIYPITFTLRDLAHKVLGVKGVRTLIISAAVINLLMALYFAIVAGLEPDTLAGGSDLWGSVLAPVWRITFASILAEVISELIDTEIYRQWVDRVTKKYQWSRVLVSNLFSVPIDSFLFSFLAFYGNMPTESVVQIMWSNIIIKGAVTLISLPVIYVVKDRSTNQAE
jgi:uncharacterized integral membrane protein (TIGR00697 family)